MLISRALAMIASAVLFLGIATGARATATDSALLQGLDKITARVFRLQAPVDRPIRFGALTIVLRYCDLAPPEDPPESKAFLEITERRAGEAPVPVFSGWMFASSPALSPLEHPVYDIRLLACTDLTAPPQ